MEIALFVKPQIEYAQLWPMLLVFGVACAGVLVEAFVPRARRYVVQTLLALTGLVAAFAGVVAIGLDLAEVGGGRRTARSSPRAPSPSTARPSSSGA